MKSKSPIILILIIASFTELGAQTNNGPVYERRTTVKSMYEKCEELKKESEKEPKSKFSESPEGKDCSAFEQVTNKNKRDWKIAEKDYSYSMDGMISCKISEPFHVDFDACKQSVNYYNAVLIAEKAMAEQQKIRTGIKTTSIQNEVNQKMSMGQTQSATLDAMDKTNRHMKELEIEKASTYGAAVAALIRAHAKIPTSETLEKSFNNNVEMKKFVKNKSASLLVNRSARDALKIAIANFSGKAAKAGIEIFRLSKTEEALAAANKAIQDEELQDQIFERCTQFPNDPACVSRGPRVSGQPYTSGNFEVGSAGSNSFEMGSSPIDEEGINTDAPRDITESNSVAGINSPFVNEAKEANDIINPAGAAQMQPTGGAQGGASPAGGSGSLGGGGGASLGNDLSGADKDGNKESQIKTSNASTDYEVGSGGGARGGGKSSDDGNPFASLFETKPGGGIEEDRSIASGDIDGSSSGLFQKISKRYGQVQADKRIEAINLE